MIAASLLLAAALSAPTASIDLKRPEAEAPMSIVSIIGNGAALEWAGSQLAAGDLNGDGLEDLVVAAPGGSEDRPSRRGRLYVIYGSVQPRATISLTPPRAGSLQPANPPDVVINGADDFDHLGRALVVADFDGDGLADIAAGSPRADGALNARPDCGEITILFGATSLPRVIELASPPAGVRVTTIIGSTAGDTLGASLAAADLSGDKIPDLIAGAPLADGVAGALGALDTGAAVALVMVKPVPAQIDLSWKILPLPAAIWSGRDAGDQAGSAVAAGDFDGDGFADIAVGARGADGLNNTSPESGEVYLMLGPSIPGGVLDDVADMVLLGADVGDLSGSSLLLADLDADGLADLIAGAEGADGAANGRLDTGEVVIMQGRSRTALQALRPPPPPEATAASSMQQRLQAAMPGAGGPRQGPLVLKGGPDAAGGLRTLPSRDPGDHINVRAAGDLDGDGRNELVLGAEDASSRRNARAGGGEALVILANGRVIEILGPTGGAHLGRAACAVDWDGDGRRELAIAAPQAGRSVSGRVWVLKLKEKR